MTFERVFNDLSTGKMKPQEALTELSTKEKMKRINYYAHINDIRAEPLN